MNKKLITYAVAALFAASIPMAGCTALSSANSTSSTSTSKTKKLTATEVSAESHSSSANAASKATLSTNENLAGEWVITAVGTTVISQDEDMPYVTFVPSEGRFYGSNGCNVINGDYSVSGTKITFGNVLATMKYCPEVEYDGQITALFGDGKSATFTIKKSGNESVLNLIGTDNGIVITLCRHNMQFLNGQWQVTDINGKGVNDDEANIFFDVDELKIHGNTGCNFFNGSILIDPAKSNSVNFSGMAVTHMSCPKLDQERLMLVALEETETAVKNSDGTVSLRNGSGKTVIKLKKIEVVDD